jgi:hypothetical protein
MCMGNVACKSCARKTAMIRGTRKKRKRKSTIISSLKGIKNMDFVKSTLKILKPAAAGVVGYLAAKAINNIPIGTDKTVGSSPYISGGIKIAIAAFAPSLLGKKMPLVTEASIGIAMAGVSDIAKAILPVDIATKLGIAGPRNGGGLHGILPPRRGNAIAGNGYTRIGCEPSKSETSIHA